MRTLPDLVRIAVTIGLAAALAGPPAPGAVRSGTERASTAARVPSAEGAEEGKLRDPSPGSRLTIRGRIAEVDVARNLVTVDSAAHGSVTFEVPEGAVIVLDGEPGAIAADLFPGDAVVRADLKASRSMRWYLIEAKVSSTE